MNDKNNAHEKQSHNTNKDKIKYIKYEIFQQYTPDKTEKLSRAIDAKQICLQDICSPKQQAWELPYQSTNFNEQAHPALVSTQPPFTK